MFVLSLWVALGGALGTLGRFWAQQLLGGWLGTGFPWGTVIVNITGCFVIGFFAVLAGPEGRLPVSSLTRQFVMTGICGGYTTFSAFSWQTLDMAHRGAWGEVAVHVGGSVLLCLTAVWLGAVAAGALNAARAG
jgi:CrcB protein